MYHSGEVPMGTGEITSSTSRSEPSLRRLTSRPRHGFPESSRGQRSAYTSGGMRPLLRKDTYCPTTSSAAYP